MRRFLAISVCVLVLASGYGVYVFNKTLTILLPDYPTPRENRWLPGDWASQQGARFQHADQGTMTFRVPYGWVVTLRQPALSGAWAAGRWPTPAT